MLLPANRMIGDDGTLVSPREISESAGVSLELLNNCIAPLAWFVPRTLMRACSRGRMPNLSFRLHG